MRAYSALQNPAQHIVQLSLSERYMRVAVWMCGYLYRRNPLNGTYRAIFNEVAASKQIAGGPALRLAQALWAFDARKRFPKDKTLRVEEENAFAHLYHHHNDPKKERYHVWKAMDLFIEMRINTFGHALLRTIEQLPLDTPHPLRRAIRLMDKAVIRCARSVQKDKILVAALDAITEANPTDEALLLAVVNATETYATWLRVKSGVNFEAFQVAANQALHQQYRNAAYLTHQHPKLNAAISGFRRVLNNLPA